MKKRSTFKKKQGGIFMAVTVKGNNLIKVLQQMLNEREDNATLSVEEIAEESGLARPSVLGTLPKLIKEGYIVSEPFEIDGKKRKRISLTDLGWEHNVEAFEAPEA